MYNRRTVTGIALLLLVAALPNLELEWRAPPGCPSRSFVESEIARLLGGIDQTSPLIVEVDLRQGPGVWVAALRLRGARGDESRELEGETCESLAKAVAVITAMVLTEAPLDEKAPQPVITGTVAAPPSRREPLIARSVATSPAFVAEPPFRLALRIDLLGDVGILPHPGPGIGLSLGLTVDVAVPIRFELGGGAWWPQSRTIRATPQAGGEFGLWWVQGRGCLAPPLATAWTLYLCGGMEFAVSSAEGFGVSTPLGTTTAIPGVVGEVRISPVISGAWRAMVSLQAVLPLARPVFELEPIGDVHQAREVGFRGALGLEFGIL